MRKYLYVLILLGIFSCSKKEIKLPIVSEKGVQEITNFTQLWLFYEVKNNKPIATFNKNNTISGTHWVINIDKRHLLKDVFPVLEEIRKKRLKKSPHSAEGMHNYLSYSDKNLEKLSFLAIDNQEFILNNPISHDTDYNNIDVTFNENDVVFNNKTIDSKQFKNELLKFEKTNEANKKQLLHLIFDEDLTYQNYIYYKTILQNVKSKSFLISKKEHLKAY